jgi:hypothetical protein
MVYICRKDFSIQNCDVKEGELVDIKFGHQDGQIYCYYITHESKEHKIYKVNVNVLNFFDNLVKWRNSQIDKIIIND